MSELLDWAEDKGVIAQSQHATLMREFSRRIESKKRVVNRGNLISMGKNMGVNMGVSVGGMMKNIPSVGNLNFLGGGQGGGGRKSDDNDNFVGIEVTGEGGADGGDDDERGDGGVIC